MRSEVPLGTRTYPFATCRWINPVNDWTLGGIANSLKNRCLPRVGSSNNKDSKLDVEGKFRKDLLCSHSTYLCKMEDCSDQGPEHDARESAAIMCVDSSHFQNTLYKNKMQILANQDGRTRLCTGIRDLWYVIMLRVDPTCSRKMYPTAHRDR
jgi:hypothetical protein